MTFLRSIARDIVPPALLRYYRKRRASYSFTGSYSSWEEALKDSSGYGDPSVVATVRASVEKVLSGTAAFERDGVTFERPEYEWPLLSGLFLAAAENGGRLDVVDVGGGLGSTFLRYRSILLGMRSVRWTVVEQPSYVKAGRELFPDRSVLFTDDLRPALRKRSVNVVLLCSVLPYVPRPYELLETVVKGGSRYVILDRTAVVDGDDRLTVQTNRPPLYRASYPAWFLNETRLRRGLERSYETICEFPALESAWVSGIPGARDVGMICRKRSARRR